MGLQHSVTPIVTNGLLFNLDATNPRSYNGQENLISYSNYDPRTWRNLFPQNTTLVTGIDAPDGTNTAVRIICNDSTGGTATGYRASLFRVNFPDFTADGSTTYTVSFYVRLISGSSSNSGQLTFDLHDAGPGLDYKPLLVQNQWVRVSASAVPVSGVKNFLDLLSDNTCNYTLDFWGVQIENGSFATTLTPTNGSQVRRTWFDLTNNLYNAVLTNNPVLSNNTLQFRATGQNATNQYGTITIDEGILRSNNKTKSWSLEAFFRYVSAPGNAEAGIIAREGCNSGIYINVDGTLQHFIKTNQCWTGAIGVTLATLTAGTFYHTLMVYNAGTVTSYLNGVQVGTTSLDLNTYDIFSHGTQMYIGGIRTLYATNTDINIIRGYNRSLTATEVNQNFQSVRRRFGI